MASKKSVRGSGSKKNVPVEVLSPDATRAWLSRYCRHSRIYSWGFFAVMLPIVFGVIWWSMGELNQDVFMSFGFFALVFFILAVVTRRKSMSAWSGNVRRKYEKKVVVRSRDGNAPDQIEFRHVIEVRTDRGKKITLRVTPDLYTYFEEGERVFKIAGPDWPEKATLGKNNRVCMVCGAVLPLHDGMCSRCRAPIPDHPTLCSLANA